MAWNHWRSGLRVPWEIVPAVMDDWCPHPLQCIKPRWVSHASPDKHRGQRKPDGQRTLMRYCRLLSSVANHRSNSPSVRGYSESTTSVRYPWESLEARGYVDAAKSRISNRGKDSRYSLGRREGRARRERVGDRLAGQQVTPAMQIAKLLASVRKMVM